MFTFPEGLPDQAVHAAMSHYASMHAPPHFTFLTSLHVHISETFLVVLFLLENLPRLVKRDCRRLCRLPLRIALSAQCAHRGVLLRSRSHAKEQNQGKTLQVCRGIHCEWGVNMAVKLNSVFFVVTPTVKVSSSVSQSLKCAFACLLKVFPPLLMLD